MNGHIKEPRYRIYRVSDAQIVTALGQWTTFDTLELPIPANLPEGWELHGVEHSFLYRGFALLVWAPSFDPVPVGTQIPIADEAVSFRRVAIKLTDEQRQQIATEAPRGN